jgi:hypothetical protein
MKRLSRRKFFGLLAFAFLFGNAGAALADTEVTIFNNSNDTINVSRAYLRPKVWRPEARLANQGWEVVEPGRSVTFQEDGATGLHIRIEKRGAEYLPGPGPFDTRNYLLIRQGFTASIPTSDDKVTILEWDNGRRIVHIKQGTPLPEGWELARYLRIDPRYNVVLISVEP